MSGNRVQGVSTLLDRGLLVIKEKFWNVSSEVYRQDVGDRCLVVFSEMAGTMSKSLSCAGQQRLSRAHCRRETWLSTSRCRSSGTQMKSASRGRGGSLAH